MLLPKLESLLNKFLTLKQAKQIHVMLLVNDLSHFDHSLIHQILSSSNNFSYTCSTTQYVHLILQYMKNPDSFSWSCTIRFLCYHKQFREAFALYIEMHRVGLTPPTFAISSALKSCAKIMCRKGGDSIHAHIFKYGFCGDVYAETAVVDYYSKAGNMVFARRVFDEMGDKNVVSWNSILAGYLKCGDIATTHSLFNEMPSKDVISWNSLISGYGRAGNMEQAYALFREMPRRNSASWNGMICGYIDCGKIGLARNFFDSMPARNKISWISMISGYSRCGDVVSAKELFDQMEEKNLLLYNVMIGCYAQNSRADEALQLFKKMLDVNIQPDKFTFCSVISACSQLGDMRFGSRIESLMSEFRIKMDDHLATALLDLYAKCGNIDKAYELFQGLEKKDVIAYTAIILGFGINGRAADAIKLFEEMVASEIYPNLVTFTGILTAHNHVGLVQEGYKCFELMQKHGLVPSVDHCAIMVDLLGRAGKLKEAYELIKSMPMQPHAGVWGALLLACNIHNNVEFGEVAAKHCFELEPDTTGYRSLLANIYASAGRWDDAKSLREGIDIQDQKKIPKIPGSSWTDAISDS